MLRLNIIDGICYEVEACGKEILTSKPFLIRYINVVFAVTLMTLNYIQLQLGFSVQFFWGKFPIGIPTDHWVNVLDDDENSLSRLLRVQNGRPILLIHHCYCKQTICEPRYRSFSFTCLTSEDKYCHYQCSTNDNNYSNLSLSEKKTLARDLMSKLRCQMLSPAEFGNWTRPTYLVVGLLGFGNMTQCIYCLLLDLVVLGIDWYGGDWYTMSRNEVNEAFVVYLSELFKQNTKCTIDFELLSFERFVSYRLI